MASIAALCQGTWLQDLSKDENIEEYFKALGLNRPLRILAKKIKTNMKIVVDESKMEWAITRTNKVETKTSTFKMGETFKDKAWDGKETTNEWVIDGHNKLVGVSSGYCKHPIHIIMEFVGDVMTQTLSINGVVAKIHFNRQK